MIQIIKPLKNTDPKTLVVMGCPRGGTSAVSGLLHHSGIFMGDSLGRQYEDPDFHQWLERSYGKRDREVKRRIEVIHKRNQEKVNWGFKDTNVVHYFAEILPHLRNPVILAVVRDPYQISLSSAKHEKKPWGFNLLRNASIHYGMMMQTLDRHKQIPRAIIDFEDLRKNPEEVIKEVESFILMRLDKEKGTTFLQTGTYIHPKNIQ
jgi:hypothetical protein